LILSIVKGDHSKERKKNNSRTCYEQNIGFQGLFQVKYKGRDHLQRRPEHKTHFMLYKNIIYIKI